jgi:hypothetical protein
MNTYLYTDTSDRYYRTKSFYTSAFLFAKGVELVNIDRSNKHSSFFVFLDKPERELYLNAFNFARDDDPTVLIDVRKYVMAIKMLKDKLYQPIV